MVQCPYAPPSGSMGPENPPSTLDPPPTPQGYKLVVFLVSLSSDAPLKEIAEQQDALRLILDIVSQFSNLPGRME